MRELKPRLSDLQDKLGTYNSEEATMYSEAYQNSILEPEEFWGRAAREVKWYKPFRKVFDDSNKPFYRWFVGGELNTCFNAVDYHAKNGRGEQIAIIYDSPMTGTIRKITYNDLWLSFQNLLGFCCPWA